MEVKARYIVKVRLEENAVCAVWAPFCQFQERGRDLEFLRDEAANVNHPSFITWICLRCFFLLTFFKTMINHHFSPPLGEDFFIFFQSPNN